MPDEDLASRFRTWLRDADLKPGDRIPGEIELAGRFRVSRAAVREVIMHYCHLGVLERVRNRGTSVRVVSPERLGDDLAGLPDQRQLKIVDRSGRVGGKERDHAPLHPINDQWPKSVLEGMRA